MPQARAPSRCVALLLAATVTGCATSPREMVASLASRDLNCQRERIDVTRLDRALEWHSRANRYKGQFRADGCGATARYECDGWDNYSQMPICHPGGEWSRAR